MEKQTLEQRLKDSIRIVADFPKPGISFKDITPVFFDPELVKACAQALAEPFKDLNINKVVGIESRGFLLGPMIAQELGCGFVLIRKKGKLPGNTHQVSYDLEYGSATIEAHEDAIQTGEIILVHDDLLATGGTAIAAAQLCMEQGALLGGFTFLIELASLQGRSRLDALATKTISMASYLD